MFSLPGTFRAHHGLPGAFIPTVQERPGVRSAAAAAAAAAAEAIKAREALRVAGTANS
jgi:hypothetical protein